MTKKRVVVTGLGAVSPVGLTVMESWRNISAGQSGITKISRDIEAKSQIAGVVKNFDVSDLLSSKEARKMDLFIQYGIAAAEQAIHDAKLTAAPLDNERIGVLVGSGIGGLPLIEKSHSILLESGPRKMSPMFIPGVIINMLAGHISIRYGFKGPNLAVATACSTGSHSIGMAARAIAYGDADVMIAGGAECASCSLGLVGFSAMRALSTCNDKPEKASRPWDKDRDGFVLADGAGVIVLEEYEHAMQRGAEIYAELSGFGMSADAYHMTLPSGDGAANAIRNALNDAGLNADSIDYINAHATSTQAGDRIELESIKQVLGEHASNVAISSTKSMTGHLLGAAGAVEAIFSILALRDNMAPPTINLDEPDADYGLNLVPHTAQERVINTVLSNSFGFGGTNASLVFSRLNGE